MARLPTFGLPRMHKEPGEKRDFLPPLVGVLAGLGCEVFVETSIGSDLGFDDDDYRAVSPRVRVVSHEEAFAQDVVLVLRAPDLDEYSKLKPGSTLIAMLHFPTRPRRVRKLREHGVEAISLDSIADDEGKRLVESMKSVAWNGVEAAFDALAHTWPDFDRSDRRPIRVTVLGAGRVGKHAVEAATKYGDLDEAADRLTRGYRGGEVTVVGRNLTRFPGYMEDRLAVTDVLVDASQRGDASKPLIPHGWIAWLPTHAVICDLVVDPYILDVDPPTVRSIEGIPQGTLDKYIFFPDDPDYSMGVPSQVPRGEPRAVASCYSWPGVRPKECMEHYGRQLVPLLEALVKAGGVEGLRPDGDFWERALYRASLRFQPGLSPEESSRPDAG